MLENKNYKYKIWMEVERVEVDASGEEIGEPERGERFGYDPEELFSTEDVERLDIKRDQIITANILLD
jgi:hypothetical protein